MKTIIPGVLLVLFIVGCGTNNKQQVATTFQKTEVSFTTGNEEEQELFDSAENKVVKNIIQYNDEYRVMVEGAVYPFPYWNTFPGCME